MTKILVDSTCDLPDKIMEQYDIRLIPLHVHIKDKEYLDKVTIKIEEVYDVMREGIIPKTSQPSPKHMYDAFEDCAKNGQDFIFISFTAKLSGTYQTAVTVCEKVKEKYPDINMEVIDGKSGSTGTGLIAIQAAKLAKEKVEFSRIVEVVKEESNHIEHIFTLSNLEWLYKGGRLSKGSAVIGDLLDIKPILHLNDGRIEVIKKVRKKKKALKAILEIVEERIKEFPNQLIGITHADDLETALMIKEMIVDRLGDMKFVIDRIGSVLGTHLGIGGVGVYFFSKKPSIYID